MPQSEIQYPTDIPHSAGLDELMKSVYQELRRLAHYHNANERHNLTLQTTALVHEAYLRLVSANGAEQPEDDKHLKHLTSRIIRQLLIDQARQRNALKRSVPDSEKGLPGHEHIDPELDCELLDLNVALNRLAEKSPRLARIVELRFFGGLSIRETAEVLELSTRTVDRDWDRARAYLLRLIETD